MSKRPVNVRMESVNANIEKLKKQKEQLKREQNAEERKARTRRLCSRAGLIESMLPETITLTDEQFKLFLEKTVANSFGRDKLKEVLSQSTTAEPSETPAPPPPKTTNTAQNGGTGGRANGGDNERRDG